MINQLKNFKVWKLVDYLIWSLPLAAMTLSLYLIIDYYASRDIDIHIVFNDASSIEPLKTQLIYKGIVVGVVDGVRLDAKSNNVVVRANLDHEAKELAAEGTRFKIIQPKVGFSGISGLETLLKGSYIRIEKGTVEAKNIKKIKKTFVGTTTDDEDTRDAKSFTLRAQDGRALSVGMPIEFKGVKIGSVVAVDFEGLGREGLNSDRDILVRIGIENKYAEIINDKSRFWRRPAVQVQAGINGLNFEVSSLEALMKGSILVDGSEERVEPAKSGQEFTLYDKRPAKKVSAAESKQFQLTTNDAESLQKNDPIFYRGVKTGKINGVELKADGSAVVRVEMDAKYQQLVKANSVFWRKSAVDSKLGWSGLSLRVSSLESLVKGGINFATPTKFGADVKSGVSFALRDDEPDGDWKNWKPNFPPQQKSIQTKISTRYD